MSMVASEEGVDEWGDGGPGQRDQHAEQQQDVHNRQEPPLLVLRQESEEFADQRPPGLPLRGPLEVVQISFAHGRPSPLRLGSDSDLRAIVPRDQYWRK